jgi:hypothetical protein
MNKTREVLFEFRKVGNAVKVSAVDAATGTEVSIVGDARAPQAQLKALALKKLDFVMSKKG